MEELIKQAFQSIKIINDELGAIKIDIAVLKAQMSMVLKLQWAVLIIVIGFVVSKILAKTFNKK